MLETTRGDVNGNPDPSRAGHLGFGGPRIPRANASRPRCQVGSACLAGEVKPFSGVPRLSPNVLVVVAVLLVQGSPYPAYAQTVVGRVFDASSGAGLENALVLMVSVGANDTVRALTDARGGFSATLTSPGAYDAVVQLIGYRATAPFRFEAGEGQRLSVQVPMVATAVELDEITVQVDGFELRHQATLDGFYRRLEDARPVGPTRLFHRDDPTMRTSLNVRDLMTYLPIERRTCIRLYIDGIERRNWINEYRNLSLAGIEGVEFYKNPLDAPLELRDAGSCAVLALWRERMGE